MTDLASTIATALFLALVLEKLIEMLVKPALPEQYSAYTIYVSAVLGVLFAYGLNVDLVTPTLEQAGITPALDWVGKLITGLVLAGGSNLIHDLWPSETS